MSNSTGTTSVRLGELMNRATPPHSLQEHLEGRARLIASVERMRGARRGVAIAAIAGVTAVAAGLFLLGPHSRARSLAWHVENATVEAQGYISVSPAASSARLEFDDGSEVSLAPGARGRVQATSPTGAEVVLEQGRASVHVQHRDRTAWTIDAGPYAVHVTGTDFVVSWAADVETLDVWMRSGRVVVTGPTLGDELALTAGKHLVAKLHERTTRIDGSPEPSEAQAPLPVPPVLPIAAPAVERPSETASPSAARPAAAGPSWSTRVSAGGYAGVVDDAESDGMSRVLALRPLADLRALGDAARYAGRADIAKRAYTAIRERFASSPDARMAAFLLGRVAEEEEHATGEALRWYDTYVLEAPGGALAGDALGRKMVLVSRAQGRDAARSLAQRYLESFPGGTYSAAARDLVP
jgi:FecR-like protein